MCSNHIISKNVKIMQFLKSYSKKIIKYDLINKFNFINIGSVLNSINHNVILVQINLPFKRLTNNQVLSNLLIFKLITFMKPLVLSHIVGLKKGKFMLYGQVILKQKNFFLFFSKFIWMYNPKLYKNKFCFNLSIEPLYMFRELEPHFEFFMHVKTILITFKFSNTIKSNDNPNFILQSFKIYFQ